LINWFLEKNFKYYEVNFDEKNYKIFLKNNINLPPIYPRLLVVSYQSNKATSNLLNLCIKSIQKYTNSGYELWIIDNNSPENNIKWLNEIKNINLIYIRTDPKDGPSYANALALEIAIKYIDPDTKYVFSFHEDTVVCKEGWLDYMISKLTEKVKAAGFRLTKARIPDGVLHVCGYVIDFQIFKQLKLSYLPELPDFDVGDKAIYELKKNGYDIFYTPNTFDNPETVNLLPANDPLYKLNTTRAFNDNNEVIYMHLGRGVRKAIGNYSDKNKCTYKDWNNYIRKYLL